MRGGPQPPSLLMENFPFKHCDLPLKQGDLKLRNRQAVKGHTVTTLGALQLAHQPEVPMTMREPAQNERDCCQSRCQQGGRDFNHVVLLQCCTCLVRKNACVQRVCTSYECTVARIQSHDLGMTGP